MSWVRETRRLYDLNYTFSTLAFLALIWAEFVVAAWRHSPCSMAKMPSPETVTHQRPRNQLEHAIATPCVCVWIHQNPNVCIQMQIRINCLCFIQSAAARLLANDKVRFEVFSFSAVLILRLQRSHGLHWKLPSLDDSKAVVIKTFGHKQQ